MLEELSKYIIDLDKDYINMIDKDIAEKGIDKYLSQQLVYLDCSRVINGMRMMQTIGYPYQKEISAYWYASNKFAGNDFDVDKRRIVALLERHQANLEYEKENPPVWYGDKKAKDKWDKEHSNPARRRKANEGTLPGMGKEISNKERLKKLSAQFGNLTFKIKPPKKDE